MTRRFSGALRQAPLLSTLRPSCLPHTQAAEGLQLFLELQGDAALKAQRWRAVSLSLFERPLQPERVLGALALSPSDRACFLAHLDSKVE